MAFERDLKAKIKGEFNKKVLMVMIAEADKVSTFPHTRTSRH
jgi:hypothetical protein